jgi:ABC-2 type transport system permease protein
MNALVQAFGDGAVVAKRNLIKIRRVPDLLVFTTLSPIMFVLLFAYIFGGAVDVGGSGPDSARLYREFLIAGIFAQTVVFGSTITGMSIAEDLQKGVIDRFRSLPMSGSAVLVGRTAADVVNNVIAIAVMGLTGLVVGWRIRTSLLDALIGFFVLLLFAYAFSWLMACVGLLVRTPEVVNNASFIVIFPLTFCANTFVPLETLPGPLRVFAEWNPVSTVTLAARERFGNVVAGAPASDAWPLQYPVLYTVLWTAVILAVFIPVAIRMYHRAASR